MNHYNNHNHSCGGHISFHHTIAYFILTNPQFVGFLKISPHYNGHNKSDVGQGESRFNRALGMKQR